MKNWALILFSGLSIGACKPSFEEELQGTWKGEARIQSILGEATRGLIADRYACEVTFGPNQKAIVHTKAKNGNILLGGGLDEEGGQDYSIVGNKVILGDLIFTLADDTLKARSGNELAGVRIALIKAH